MRLYPILSDESGYQFTALLLGNTVIPTIVYRRLNGTGRWRRIESFGSGLFAMSAGLAGGDSTALRRAQIIEKLLTFNAVTD